MLVVTATVAVGVAGVLLARDRDLGPFSTVLDPAAVERDVAAQFRAMHGVDLELECSAPMTVRTGAGYTCEGVTSADERVTIELRITDEDTADYTWSEP